MNYPLKPFEKINTLLEACAMQVQGVRSFIFGYHEDFLALRDADIMPCIAVVPPELQASVGATDKTISGRFIVSVYYMFLDEDIVDDSSVKKLVEKRYNALDEAWRILMAFISEINEDYDHMTITRWDFSVKSVVNVGFNRAVAVSTVIEMKLECL